MGLAASHLHLYTADCAPQALAHRVKAIGALNESLSRPCTSTAEGDARFAAIMALSFQASCMPDGMAEYLSMARGCHIVASTRIISSEHSLFHAYREAGYSKSIRRISGSGGAVLDPDQEALVDECLEALRALAPLCTSPLERQILATTERLIKLAKVSLAEGQ